MSVCDDTGEVWIIFLSHMMGVPFRIGILVWSDGRHMVAPAAGIVVVLCCIMPCWHASAKIWRYASDEKKFPIISAMNIVGPCVSVCVIAVCTELSVEKPVRTLPLYCLVCWRAPLIASPFAAWDVSTMMRLAFRFLAVILDAAVLEKGACFPGPISMMLQFWWILDVA